MQLRVNPDTADQGKQPVKTGPNAKDLEIMARLTAEREARKQDNGGDTTSGSKS